MSISGKPHSKWQGSLIYGIIHPVHKCRKEYERKRRNPKKSMIQEFDLTQIVEPLQNWFEHNARVLPWRNKPLAYYVWVSEIMLQQTRVEAVKPYFERFILELPDVEALAKCEEDRLLKLWEGLGYYNRVRNMNIAARQVMEEYGGVIPSDYNTLQKLKGIGHYTAGAISSIAYGRPYPAVDGNVLRVLSRVSMDSSDIMKQSVKNLYEELLTLLMQEENTKVVPAKFNQALMELGACVCVPNGEPHCMECPLKALCEAHKNGNPLDYPVKSKAKQRRVEPRTVLVVKDDERVALHKRPSKGLLAGLYELPNLDGNLSPEEVLAFLKSHGFSPIRIQKLPDSKHIFSHVEWQMTAYVVKVEENYEQTMNWVFAKKEDAKETYAIPSAFHAYTEWIKG